MNKKDWIVAVIAVVFCVIIVVVLSYSQKAEANHGPIVEDRNQYPSVAGYKTYKDGETEPEEITVIEDRPDHTYQYNYIVEELDYFIGLNLGFFNSSNDDKLAMDAAPAWGLVMGVEHDEKFTLEFEYYRSGKVDAMTQGLDPVSGDMQITTYGIYFNYIHNQSDPVYLTVKGGIVNEHLKLKQTGCIFIDNDKTCRRYTDKDVDTSFSFGFGFGVNIYDNVSIELDHTFLDDSRSLNALTLVYDVYF